MTDALHDPLTKLPTRALLREHARVAVARARRRDRHVALLHSGLDGFALVNDSLGRPAGDAVLKEAAQRVRAAVPDVHVVGRPGGDEFCILLADLDGDAQGAAGAIGAQIASVLEEPYRAGGRSFELGASIGVSTCPDDASDEDALLRHADAALRQAKQSPDGGVVFYAGGTSDALQRLLLTSRLRSAIASGQLFLEYQPIFRLPSKRIPMVEALVRWADPERGVVPPCDFIPAAEQTGLIDEIGAWVLDAVCAQARAWEKEGLEIAVCVNVSLRQFRDPGFAASVRQRIEATGLHPARLIVEITESTAMLEARCVEPVLRQLRATGVRLAIDDFGTGHSSLGRLRDLDVDVLKLDGGFLPRNADDRRAGRLVDAALGLVDALDLAAVVEGVETGEQFEFLLARGGHRLAQGFHLARPMSAEAVGALLRESAG